ncbi:unnamed protein product [Rangifer tarandus platyrhynchus]|uniref:Uncharacterized protein n=2 Tax=Rangifer tarandus platyrhynchus TaxID=3082113 RepID=A0ABN8XX65_RANTA|nr:unnamed protein product [Rangifer tarandus platyrhynchus]CAI9692484.1 unnamed protein product [Rangifer tarandus platyrhynchus]
MESAPQRSGIFRKGLKSHARLHDLLLILAFSGTPGFTAGEKLTFVTQFLLATLTARPEGALPRFRLLLFGHLVTLSGTVGLITLTRVAPRLQSPMYSPLSHRSLPAVCCSSVTVRQTTAALLERGAAPSRAPRRPALPRHLPGLRGLPLAGPRLAAWPCAAALGVSAMTRKARVRP